jgi:hypothetical protein
MSQLLDLRELEVPVALRPEVEARRAKPELPADISHRRAGFYLPQRVKDLLLGKSRPPDRPLLS